VLTFGPAERLQLCDQLGLTADTADEDICRALIVAAAGHRWMLDEYREINGMRAEAELVVKDAQEKARRLFSDSVDPCFDKLFRAATKCGNADPDDRGEWREMFAADPDRTRQALTTDWCASC
jgi:hypothetical protein